MLCLQLDRRLTDRDWRWHLERSYTLSLANGQVDMFFIDTSPFVQEYQTAVWSVNEGELIPPASDAVNPLCQGQCQQDACKTSCCQTLGKP